MSAATLLVELLCEELPPKALRRLGEAFAEGIFSGLRKRELLGPASTAHAFASPRRLAVAITAVLPASEPRAIEVKLMPVSVALDAQGRPTVALTRKLQAVGLAGADPATFKRRQDGKAEALFADAVTPAVALADALQAAIDEAIAGLPIPKAMSYQLADGKTTVRFVRPVHGLVALHGTEVVPVRALGLESGRATRGHRFQGTHELLLHGADTYDAKLKEEGGVIADFDERKHQIFAQLSHQAAALELTLGLSKDYEALLDEVTALVEMPTVYAGAFEPEFLAVPAECLVLTMRQNQKYFPLFDAGGKLSNRFLIVSNMRLADPSAIVQGNERVVRARLADARFFYETDRKTKLVDRVPRLAAIVYHGKLGSQAERVERLRRLSTRIQKMLPRGAVGTPYVDRAALLAKADLLTLMVGEFPELQGTMGKYYAEADGEEPSVVRAMEQHYWPRFAGDGLPTGDVSISLALADKLEALVGLFGVGEVPTGDKDPFALRRAALGVLRILSERPEAWDLDLRTLLDEAAGGFAVGRIADGTVDAVHAFMLERLRPMLRDHGYDANETEAVLADHPTRIHRVWKRAEAVKAFRALPEADALAAANKRIRNILRKSGTGETVSAALFAQDEEKRLHASMETLGPRVDGHMKQEEFTAALKDLAGIRDDVDAFFDKVLVNADEPAVRENRLALLTRLGLLMNRVADISKLAA